MTGPIVDIHAHFLPEGLGDFAAETGDDRWPSLCVGDRNLIMRGDDVFRRVSSSCFDVQRRIADLDAAGVDHQVLSPVPITFVDWAPADAATRYHAAQNDLLAAAGAGSGGRLSAMGGVALQDPEAAATELGRFRGLGLVGVEIPAVSAGRELDDPALETFWRAASDLGIPVFIHPAHQHTATRRTGQPHEFGIGMLTDTALAASALVYGGVLEQFPDLRVGLAHGCGTFAWAQPRLQYFAGLGDAPTEQLDALARRLWVDSLVFDPAHLGILAARFGPDHIMLGTDHPFLPDGMQARLAELEAGCAAAGLTDAAFGTNALAFLGGPK